MNMIIQINFDIQIRLVKPEWFGSTTYCPVYREFQFKENNSVEEQGSVARKSSGILRVPA